MPPGLPDTLTTPVAGIAVLGLSISAGMFAVIRSHRKRRLTPEQFEVQRRQWLAQHGKLSGGEIVEVLSDSITYVYDVRGINYTASQDVTTLVTFLPEDRWTIIGGVGVRYDPRNPANSIVVCETWTGLK